MFRIQMSTKALANIVPGGSAAGSALGYRLLTLSGIQRPRRRLRPGDRRPRLGRRAQPDLLDRPARLDPAARRQPAVRHGRAGRPGDHGRRRPARPRPAARPGPGRDVPALARRASCASTRTPRPPPCARSASASRSSSPTARCCAGSCSGPASTGCSTRRRCGCSCARSVARSTSTPCSSRSAWPTSLAVIPITPGGLGIVEGIYIPTLVGFGVPPAGGDARRGVVPPRPVLVADPPRWPALRLAARRAVVDRAARPPRPPARHRPPGDVGERAAHRVRPAPVGAQAAGRAAARRRRGPPGRARRSRHRRPRGARRARRTTSEESASSVERDDGP